MFEKLQQNLVHQLLSSEGLPLSWCDTILPIIQRVADTVRPDIKNDNDDMDIRQYVQIKKVYLVFILMQNKFKLNFYFIKIKNFQIPGGTKSECCIIRGVVCTKNVAHKKVRSWKNVLNFL